MIAQPATEESFPSLSRPVSIEWADSYDIEHSGMHMKQKMTMEGPVTRIVGGQVESDLASGKNVDCVLQRMIAGVPIHQFEEVTVQVNGMLHHCVVYERHADTLISG